MPLQHHLARPFDHALQLIPQLDVDSIQRVVRNVIVKLPSYRTLSSPKGDRIVKLLLERAETEHRGASKPSLSSSHPFTDTAQSLVVNHGAPSLPLFQYYSRSFLDKDRLEPLPNPQKIRAIRSIAGLLDFCSRCTAVDPEVRQQQRTIADATPMLIEVGSLSYGSCPILLFPRSLYLPGMSAARSPLSMASSATVIK